MEADELVAVYHDCIGEQIAEYVDYERDEVYEEWADCPATKTTYYELSEVTMNDFGDDDGPDLSVRGEAIDVLANDLAWFEDIIIKAEKLLNEMKAWDAAMHMHEGSFAFEHGGRGIITYWDEEDTEVLT